MAKTREERIALHKKQEVQNIKAGKPSLSDLVEGVPALRTTAEGLVEYIKVKNVLYKKVLERA